MPKIQKSKIFLEKSGDNLYEDTGTYDEVEESELRDELVLWADYAESGPTFDSTGKYLCGGCEMRLEEDDCTRVVSPISFTTGSCRIYTKGKSEGEAMPQLLTQTEVAYTERSNVKGFGCERCQFGLEAKKEDSDKRPMWCNFWGLHVQPKACCFKNTGPDDVFAPGENAEKCINATDLSSNTDFQELMEKLIQKDFY